LAAVTGLAKSYQLACGVFVMAELDEHEKALVNDDKLTINEGWFVGVIVGCLLVVWGLVIRWWLT
jgi:hypothetical protein